MRVFNDGTGLGPFLVLLQARWWPVVFILKILSNLGHASIVVLLAWRILARRATTAWLRIFKLFYRGSVVWYHWLRNLLIFVNYHFMAFLWFFSVLCCIYAYGVRRPISIVVVAVVFILFLVIYWFWVFAATYFLLLTMLTIVRQCCINDLIRLFLLYLYYWVIIAHYLLFRLDIPHIRIIRVGWSPSFLFIRSN